MRSRAPWQATSSDRVPRCSCAADAGQRLLPGPHGRLRMIHRSCTLGSVSEADRSVSPARPTGLLHPDTHQGNFGEHLVQLIVTAAGFDCYKPNDYGDGIDLAVAWTHPDGEEVRPPNVELQVKSSRILRSVNDEWSFDLEVAHYNNLRTRGATKRLLILVEINGDDYADWIGFGSDFVRFHKAAYWADLQDKPPTTNTHTVAVRVPKANRLTPQIVHSKMLEARADFYALFGLKP